MLRNDPNESSAVCFLTSDDKHTVCGTDFLPMQINFFAENISDDSSLWRRLSITCQVRTKIKFQGRSQDFSKGGSQQGHHPGMANYIWFIPLLSLLYQRAQSYYRGMKAHTN